VIGSVVVEYLGSCLVDVILFVVLVVVGVVVVVVVVVVDALVGEGACCWAGCWWQSSWTRRQRASSSAFCGIEIGPEDRSGADWTASWGRGVRNGLLLSIDFVIAGMGYLWDP
jgi:hypothetical protein